LSTLNYKSVSTVTAFVTFILFLTLLVAPVLIFKLFQVQGDESAFFISRRAAMLFLGIASFLWLGRNATHSELRQAICVGLSLSMFALAILGVFEFVRGFVGMGIFVAVLTETIIGFAYYRIWKNNGLA
jgi:peptidoglycan/LPS O-acetylase OafA/YrhL